MTEKSLESSNKISPCGRNDKLIIIQSSQRFDRASRLAPAAGFKPVGPTLKCCADQFDSEPGLIRLREKIMNFDVDLEKIRLTAEEYYRSGDFYCSEAIVKTIKDAFSLSVSDDVIALASGFPVGIGGAGCTCGAVTGGVMALGLVFGRSKPKDKKVDRAMKLSGELHNIFKKNHKSLCCRTLNRYMIMGSSRQMKQCIAFTGEMAQETARIIIREQYNKNSSII